MKSLNRTRCYCTDAIDWLINRLKWPFALVAVFFLPSSFFACWPSVVQLVRSPALLPFLLGVAGFWLVNKVMRRTTLWTWLWVLEHETVHLLLGLLCFKVPNRWRVSSQGGHVGFDRGSNWLITMSPYVFPIIPLLAFASVQTVSSFVALQPWVLPASMGFAFAAHVAFTWMESEFRQPDIQRVGGLFSILVAPTMHLIFVAVALILSTASTSSPIRPLANLFNQIGQNGLAAWKTCAERGSQFVFADAPTKEPDSKRPSETYSESIPGSPALTSTPSGVRFERRSALKAASDSYPGGRE